MQLNRFIASAGVCSRRKAVELIEQGEISVNGQVVTSPGYRVQEKDVVMHKRRRLMAQKYDYFVLNKPAGFITTASDELGRKTVMDLMHGVTKTRLYPVGRLDKETTGVLLLTNDGSLAETLSHPRHEIAKVYNVTLNKQVYEDDLKKLSDGVMLEDGRMVCDKVLYFPTRNDSVVVHIHSGRNRIVRRLFEALGYQVKKLDRTSYAGITKRGLARGAWRRLTAREISDLKK